VDQGKIKKWWDKELLDPLVKARNKCRRILVMDPTQTNADRFKYWNNRFRAEVNKLKQQHWHNFLASTDSTTVFQALQFTKPRSGGGILPLRGPCGTITSNKEEQAKLLFTGTSVVNSACDLSDVPTPEPSFFVVYPCVTREEVARILGRLAKKKASGPDRIPNEILQLCATTLADTLASLFNRCIQEDHFPTSWRTATTVIIRKFGKPDYTSPGAYRPIALLSTISKVFESTIADRLTFWAESQGIIPDGHSGGRRGKGCEDALMALTMWVRRKWREGKTVTALFLDVKSAYPSVNPQRLIHSLRRKGCPAYLWKIIGRFLENRRTKLRLADYESAEFSIDKGLPQGSPLSVILYILYNSDLLIKNFDFDQDEVSLGFIDDVVHLTAGKTIDVARSRLAKLGENSIQWGRSHGAIFDSRKAQFVVFTHSKQAKSSFTFDGQALEPQRDVKWLGLWIDEKLTFSKQVTQAKKKADDTLGRLLKIGKALWGIREQERGILISAVLVPRVLYGIQVWFTALNRQKVTAVLDLIEHSAARFALGVLKSTPIKYLDKYRPFRSIKQTAINRITNFFLTKLTRVTHKASSIERQIRTELQWTARSFPSPVHASLNHEILVGLAAKQLEEINFIHDRHPPWSAGRHMELVIDRVGKREAKRAVKLFLDTLDPIRDLVIFTDGSAHPEEGAGAAATSADGVVSKLAFLGPPGTTSNFECELVGLRLGLEIGRDARLPSSGARITLLTDSQAAIDRLRNPRTPKPGQYILTQIQEVADSLPPSTQVTIRWCPGHVGVLGNEMADRKAAAARNSAFLDDSIRGSIAAEKSVLIRKERLWKNSPRSPFPIQSALHQLRSGHVALNAFQFKCKRAPYPICTKCGAIETVEHYLVSCARFTGARATTRTLLREERITEITARTLLFNPRAFKATEAFLQLSARLPQLRQESYSEGSHE
jgi:ribonuclease HI